MIKLWQRFVYQTRMILNKILRFFDQINEWMINLFNHHHFVIMLIVITTLIFTAKIALIPIINGDTYWFLEPWVTYIREHGGLASIGEIPISYYSTSIGNVPYGDVRLETLMIEGTTRGNYPVFYYTILALFSYLPLSNLAVVKIFSILMDFVMAAGLIMIVSQFTRRKSIQLVAYALALLAPTFFINSSMWGQTDVVYGAMALWFVFFLMRNRPKTALIFIGLALTIKIQIVFILPLVGFLFLKRKFRLVYLLIVPLVVFASFIPNYIAGMNFMTPIQQYTDLVGTYNSVNMNSGSFYAFFENINYKLSPYVDDFAIPFTFVALLTVIYYAYQQGVKVSSHAILLFATLFSILTPYLLPHMHERYFYMAEILFLAYALTRKNRWHFVFLSQLSGLLTYAKFLLGGYLFTGIGIGNNIIAALINAYLIIALIRDISLLEKEQKVLTNNSNNFS